MKHLTVIRHAKSSWKESGLDDFDRPLNARGERDAPRVGQRLAERRARPDRIVTSPALRALSTARIVAAAVEFDADSIDVLESLYLAGAESLMETIRAFEDAWQSVFLLGHNPGVTELVNLLARIRLENLPTAGAAELELDVASWREVSPGCARLAELSLPKDI